MIIEDLARQPYALLAFGLLGIACGTIGWLIWSAEKYLRLKLPFVLANELVFALIGGAGFVALEYCKFDFRIEFHHVAIVGTFAAIVALLLRCLCKRLDPKLDAWGNKLRNRMLNGKLAKFLRR